MSSSCYLWGFYGHSSMVTCVGSRSIRHWFNTVRDAWEMKGIHFKLVKTCTLLLVKITFSQATACNPLCNKQTTKYLQNSCFCANIHCVGWQDFRDMLNMNISRKHMAMVTDGAISQRRRARHPLSRRSAKSQTNPQSQERRRKQQRRLFVWRKTKQGDSHCSQTNKPRKFSSLSKRNCNFSNTKKVCLSSLYQVSGK